LDALLTLASASRLTNAFRLDFLQPMSMMIELDWLLSRIIALIVAPEEFFEIDR
jgi:hypothetical protein